MCSFQVFCVVLIPVFSDISSEVGRPEPHCNVVGYFCESMAPLVAYFERSAVLSIPCMSYVEFLDDLLRLLEIMPLAMSSAAFASSGSV